MLNNNKSNKQYQSALKGARQSSINARKRARVTDYGRICSGCKTELPWSEFHKQPGGTNGRKSKCKKCMRAHLDNWRSKNPANFRRIGWAYELKKQYGLTINEYDALLRSQGNRCAICKESGNLTADGSALIKNGKTTKLHVDHDHVTGKVRGILCNACNRGLGYFRDNTNYMLNAVQYLNK